MVVAAKIDAKNLLWYNSVKINAIFGKGVSQWVIMARVLIAINQY